MNTASYPAEPRNGLGLASLITGVIGILFGLPMILFWIAGPLAVTSLALGFAGRGRIKRRAATNGKTTWFGITSGAIAAVLAVLGFVAVLGAFEQAGEDLEQIEKDLDTQMACIDQAETTAELDACYEPATYRVPQEDDEVTITAWATGHLCVEIRTDAYAEAMRWAVAQLDETPELTIMVREMCEGWGIVAVDRALGDAEPRSHAEVDRMDGEHLAATLVFNSDAPAWPERDKRMVALHELIHAAVHADGGEWERLGHTNECASVMSRYTDCILAQDGLTDYDRRWIARAYDVPWYADAVNAVVERAS